MHRHLILSGHTAFSGTTLVFQLPRQVRSIHLSVLEKKAEIFYDDRMMEDQALHLQDMLPHAPRGAFHAEPLEQLVMLHPEYFRELHAEAVKEAFMLDKTFVYELPSPATLEKFPGICEYRSFDELKKHWDRNLIAELFPIGGLQEYIKRYFIELATPDTLLSLYNFGMEFPPESAFHIFMTGYMVMLKRMYEDP